MKNNAKHIVFLDTIPFFGGSKVATRTLLQQFPAHSKVTIVSVNPSDWQDIGFKVEKLIEPKSLVNKTQGIAYLLRHAVIAFNLIKLRLKYGKVDLMVGCSNSGNDLAIFFANKLLHSKTCQFLHGPVYPSKLLARFLASTDFVYYLPGIADSVSKLLELQDRTLTQANKQLEQHHFGRVVRPFVNGLSQAKWPTAVRAKRGIRVFWAASTLKWKGLDLLLDALRQFKDSERPNAQICYIQPHSIDLPATVVPQPMQKVSWFEQPANLDEIRQSCNVFVSTSSQEPFGLSVLEALAAGMCVLIPQDGAYWDKNLENEIDCIKYAAGDAHDLFTKLTYLQEHSEMIQVLGSNALKIAEYYRAEQLYQPLVKELLACD